MQVSFQKRLLQWMLSGSVTVMRFIHFFGLCCAFCVSACVQQPERIVDAKIVSIRSLQSKLNIDTFVVTAQDEAGVSGKKTVRKLELNCRVGDVVKATVRGISLILDKNACVR